MLVGEIADNVMEIVDEQIESQGLTKESVGKVVIGTVSGDIHNIGKDMVAALSRGEGLEVIDLGVDVEPERFIEAVEENKPNILAMSALLTTAKSEQRKVIEKLKSSDLYKDLTIIIGGGAVTPEFAEEIGADGYEPTAPLAAKRFKEACQAG